MLRTRVAGRTTLLLIAIAAGCGGGDTPPQSGEPAPGASRTGKTAALETGAKLMQAKGPLGEIAMYLVGFHPSKADPDTQMESHHYCNQVNEDFAQCVLFDGNTAGARLHGIEYIVSERLYATLPDDEKPYWHPHNYEILSGELRMPGLPMAAEKAALADKINSYGKTWHTWKSGVHGGAADSLPLGPPQLAWSFNHDGEVQPALIEERDRRMGLSTAEARRDRADLATRAKPQGGVDVLVKKFPNASGAPAGVADNGDRKVMGVPAVVMRQP